MSRDQLLKLVLILLAHIFFFVLKGARGSTGPGLPGRAIGIKKCVQEKKIFFDFFRLFCHRPPNFFHQAPKARAYVRNSATTTEI